jgi:branched-chain amino acid transport system substrate-binding protein
MGFGACETCGQPEASCVATDAALENAEAKDMVDFPVKMRKSDHQLSMPYYAATFTKNVKYDSEKTGLGWKTDFVATSDDLTLPTSCKMKRPSGS